MSNNLDNNYEQFAMGLNNFNGDLIKNVTLSLYPFESNTRTLLLDNKTIKIKFDSATNEVVGMNSALIISDLECWEILVSSANKTVPVGMKAVDSRNVETNLLIAGSVFYMNEKNTNYKMKSKSKNFFYL